ncbi:MAG: MFS transporter, partial [Trebonia sp.]
TFLTGFAPDIAAVIGMRVLASIAMGAVFPLPYAYAAELCPPRVRGRFTGIADSFLSVGYFLSPLLALVLIPSVTNDTGWRVMFFLGGLPVLFALLAWKYVPESPRWYEAKGRLADAERVLGDIEARVTAELGRPLPPAAAPAPAAAAPAPAAPVRELFSRRYLRRSVTLWTTFGGLFFVFYSIQTFMPTVVASMGFTLTSAFAFTAVIVVVSIPGKLAEAWLVERWGRRAVIIVFGTLAAIAALVFGFAHGARPGAADRLRHVLLRHRRGPGRQGVHGRELPDLRPGDGHLGHRAAGTRTGRRDSVRRRAYAQAVPREGFELLPQ